MSTHSSLNKSYFMTATLGLGYNPWNKEQHNSLIVKEIIRHDHH